MLVIKVALVLAILAGFSVKLSFPFKNGIKIDFDIEGAMIMSVIMMVTSCLVGMGACGDS